MAIDGFLLRHLDVVFNMVSVLGHQTKGCTWILILPQQPLAHFKGLFTKKSVYLYAFTHARN